MRQAMPPLDSLSREDLESEVLKLRRSLEETESHRQSSLDRLAKHIQELWLPHCVPRRRASEVSALEFARDFVRTSQPLVLTDLDDAAWPCFKLWADDEYLLTKVGDTVVSVNVTPDGRADSVNAAGQFVKPCEEQCQFSAFWRWVHGAEEGSSPAGVPYLSKQNDSLREEFAGLLEDIPASVPLAVEAFGNEPEAVNLWIGDERSVSSCHMDHYENLYTVVRGEKIFTLFPPAAVPFLHEMRCPAATYQRTAGDGRASGGECVGASEGFAVVPDSPPSDQVRDAWHELGGGQAVPWIPFDVAEPQDEARFPHFARLGRSLGVEVRVGAGEMLYLPATWYHRVAQRGLTVAVNYWHDMHFGHGFVHHMFLRDIAGLEAGEDDQDGVDSAAD